MRNGCVCTWVNEICIDVCDHIFALQLYFIINNFWGLATTLACWRHAGLYTVCIQTFLALIQLHRIYASVTKRKFVSVSWKQFLQHLHIIWDPFHLLSFKLENKTEDIPLEVLNSIKFNLGLNVHLPHCLCFTERYFKHEKQWEIILFHS